MFVPVLHHKFSAANVGFNAKTMASAADGSWLDVTQYRTITFHVKWTRNAGTAVTWQFKTSDDEGTTEFEHTTQTNAGSGSYNINEYTGTMTQSSSKNFDILLDCRDLSYIKLNDVTVTSGDASDILTITAEASA